MSPKHAAPEPEEQEVEEKQPVVASKTFGQKIFADHNLPHVGMAFIAVFYLAFCLVVFITTKSFAGVPQTVSLAFSGTLGLWFNYLTRQRSKEPDK